MKRMAVIIMLVFMLGLFIFEHIYVTRTFEQIMEQSVSFAQKLQEEKEKIDTHENIELARKLDKQWDSKKRILLLMHNQNVLNEFEMRLSRLNAAVRSNEFPMALTELEQIFRASYEQKRLFEPHLNNIF